MSLFRKGVKIGKYDVRTGISKKRGQGILRKLGILEDDKGRKKYGHENVEADGRDFEIEALEEILDCCVYIAAKLIEIQTRRDYG